MFLSLFFLDHYRTVMRPCELCGRPVSDRWGLASESISVVIGVTTDALLDAVWGHRFASDSVHKTAISDLRKVLAPLYRGCVETRLSLHRRALPCTFYAACTRDGAAGRRASATAIDRSYRRDFKTATGVGAGGWRPACRGLARWRTGDRQDHVNRKFPRQPWRHHLRTRPLRGALRHRWTVPAGAGCWP